MASFTVYQKDLDSKQIPLKTGYTLGSLLANADENFSFLCSNKSVYKLNHTVCEKDATPYKSEDGGVHPNFFESVACQKLMYADHKNQLTDIDFKKGTLATIDNYGNAQLSSIQNESSVLLESINSFPEYGWCGIKLIDDKNSVTVNRFQKSLAFFSNDKLIQSVSTVHCPSSVSIIQSEQFNEPLVAVTEFNQISIWDIRVSAKNGCITRVMPGEGQLYACAGNSQFIATAGSDRNVSVYDPRKWSIIGTWKSALKADISNIMLSQSRNEACYVSGRIDGEFACGSWSRDAVKTGRLDSNNKFRGDSRWLGMAKMDGSDKVMGICTTGTLYELHNCDVLCPSENKKRKVPYEHPEALKAAKRINVEVEASVIN